MVCKHVNEALTKIGNLGDKLREEHSPLSGNPLYEHEGPYVKHEVANDYLNIISRWASESTGTEVEFAKQFFIDELGMLSPFFVSKISWNALRERILEIVDILNKCNCVDIDDASRALKEKFVTIESYNQLENRLREKEEEVRRLEERLRTFEARQEAPPHNGGFFSSNRG